MPCLFVKAGSKTKERKISFQHEVTACYVFYIINIDSGFKIRIGIGVMPAPWHFMGLPGEDGRIRGKVLNRRVWHPFSASNSHVCSQLTSQRRKMIYYKLLQNILCMVEARKGL